MRHPKRFFQMIVNTRNNSGYTIMARRSYPAKLEVSDTIFKDALRVARDAFHPETTEHEARSYFVPNNLLLIAVSNDNGMKVGFATSIYDIDSCNLYSTLIARSHQGKGICSTFMAARITDGLGKGYSLFKATTQNPNAERSILKTLSSLRLKGKITGYSVHREIAIGKFGKMLTNEVPVSKDHRTNAIYSSLDYDRGDAFNLRFSVDRTNIT